MFLYLYKIYFTCVCVSVCMHVYVHMCVCNMTSIYSCMNKHICMNICIFVWMCLCTFMCVHTFMYVCMYAHLLMCVCLAFGCLSFFGNALCLGGGWPNHLGSTSLASALSVEWRMVAHAYDPRTWQVEAGGLWVWGQPRLHRLDCLPKSRMHCPYSGLGSFLLLLRMQAGRGCQGPVCESACHSLSQETVATFPSWLSLVACFMTGETAWVFRRASWRVRL